MTASLSTHSPIREIVFPFTENDELLHYNSKLQEAIDQIRNLRILHSDSREEAEEGIRFLQHRINTNNHYVAYQKGKNPRFSVYFCMVTEDLPGLKFLLRTGADPNEKTHGKSPIHIAALKGLAEFIKVLKQHPQIDLNLKNRVGKTAVEIACNDEIRKLLED